MKQHDIDYLLYAMTHVARKGHNERDRRFAKDMADAAEDRWFKPTKAQLEQMVAVEARFYGEWEET